MNMQKPARRCGKPAPDKLVFDTGVRVLCTKEISKHGWHTGDHKGHHTVIGLGKTTVTWSQGAEYRPTKQPPVIELGGSGGALKGGVRTGTIRCTCPEWFSRNGGRLHHTLCDVAR